MSVYQSQVRIWAYLLLMMSFSDTAFFTHRRFVATLHPAYLLVPFSHQHLLTPCLCITFWYLSQYIKLFLIIIFVIVNCDH